jgi:formylglycine-generating enzyme required for sulfatase activity
MGAADPPDMDVGGMKAKVDSRPVHRVYADGFFMDRTDVTNAEFAEFVNVTGYVTVAERKPSQAEFPSAPPENLVAGSVVFCPPDHPVSLVNRLWDAERLESRNLRLNPNPSWTPRFELSVPCKSLPAARPSCHLVLGSMRT